LIITNGLSAVFFGYIAVTQVLEWRRTRSNFELMASLGNFIFALETIVNAFFCFEFSNNNHLQRLVTWATVHQSNNLTVNSSLRRAAWGGWAACLLFLLFYGGMSFYWHFNPPLFVIVSASMYVQMCYLCILWLWMNWAIHTTAQNWVQHRLDADTVLGVGGRDAGKELWEILEQMKEVSSVWAKNHAVRLATTTALATNLLILVEYEMHGEGMHGVECEKIACETNALRENQLVTSVLLYTLVWLTAAVPGYINDTFFSNLNRKLYTMWPEPDANPAPISVASVLPVITSCQHQPHQLTPLEARTLALMQRAHYLQGREGMHFAFVPMSLARAITVGTVLGYTIVFATRISK
jgi:hypothetical protein